MTSARDTQSNREKMHRHFSALENALYAAEVDCKAKQPKKPFEDSKECTTCFFCGSRVFRTPANCKLPKIRALIGDLPQGDPSGATSADTLQIKICPHIDGILCTLTDTCCEHQALIADHLSPGGFRKECMLEAEALKIAEEPVTAEEMESLK